MELERRKQSRISYFGYVRLAAYCDLDVEHTQALKGHPTGCREASLAENKCLAESFLNFKKTLDLKFSTYVSRAVADLRLLLLQWRRCSEAQDLRWIKYACCKKKKHHAVLQKEVSGCTAALNSIRDGPIGPAVGLRRWKAALAGIRSMLFEYYLLFVLWLSSLRGVRT